MSIPPNMATSSPALAAPPSWLSDWWPHLTAAFGAGIAIGLGAGDHFFAHDGWGQGVDLSLVWAGLGGLGVTVTAVVAGKTG